MTTPWYITALAVIAVALLLTGVIGGLSKRMRPVVSLSAIGGALLVTLTLVALQATYIATVITPLETP